MTIIANYIRQQSQHQTQLTEIYQAILAVVPQETTEKLLMECRPLLKWQFSAFCGGQATFRFLSYAISHPTFQQRITPF